MAIVAKDNRKDFTPAPEGLWPAVCCDVVDLGMVDSPWGERHQVEVRWFLDQKDEQSGKLFMAVKRFTLSLHEKSNLRPTLESWRGRKFAPEELEGFDLEKLLGANCQVQIIHNISSEGRTYGNVQAVVPPSKGAVRMRVPPDYVRVCDRTKNHGEEPFEPGDEDLAF